MNITNRYRHILSKILSKHIGEGVEAYSKLQDDLEEYIEEILAANRHRVEKEMYVKYEAAGGRKYKFYKDLIIHLFTKLVELEKEKELEK